LGSASEAMVKRLGFNHIQAVANVESNARKLAMGRIDAWAVAYGTALYAQSHFQGLPVWQTGAVLGKYSIYFGGRRGMDVERVKLWRQAFESMKHDGSYERILMEYHYAVPTILREAVCSPMDDDCLADLSPSGASDKSGPRFAEVASLANETTSKTCAATRRCK
jgi:hypothetical protein